MIPKNVITFQLASLLGPPQKLPQRPALPRPQAPSGFTSATSSVSSLHSDGSDSRSGPAAAFAGGAPPGWRRLVPPGGAKLRNGLGPEEAPTNHGLGGSGAAHQQGQVRELLGKLSSSRLSQSPSIEEESRPGAARGALPRRPPLPSNGGAGSAGLASQGPGSSTKGTSSLLDREYAAIVGAAAGGDDHSSIVRRQGDLGRGSCGGLMSSAGQHGAANIGGRGSVESQHDVHAAAGLAPGSYDVETMYRHPSSDPTMEPRTRLVDAILARHNELCGHAGGVKAAHGDDRRWRDGGGPGGSPEDEVDLARILGDLNGGQLRRRGVAERASLHGGPDEDGDMLFQRGAAWMKAKQPRAASSNIHSLSAAPSGGCDDGLSAQSRGGAVPGPRVGAWQFPSGEGLSLRPKVNRSFLRAGDDAGGGDDPDRSWADGETCGNSAKSKLLDQLETASTRTSSKSSSHGAATHSVAVEPSRSRRGAPAGAFASHGGDGGGGDGQGGGQPPEGGSGGARGPGSNPWGGSASRGASKSSSAGASASDVVAGGEESALLIDSHQRKTRVARLLQTLRRKLADSADGKAVLGRLAKVCRNVLQHPSSISFCSEWRRLCGVRYHVA